MLPELVFPPSKAKLQKVFKTNVEKWGKNSDFKARKSY